MANTTIQIKHSTITGNVPSSLANGEISINNRDGKFFYSTPAGSIITHYPFTGPAGLTTEIQFNDSGTLGSNSGLTFDKATGYFTAPIVASTNNGNGTNFKVGDDIWIGDVNTADTLRLTGQQNVNNAYIIFGASDSSKLGRSGTDALTYTGAFTSTGLVSGSELTSTNSSGDEGGQVNLALAATNQSLSGGVAIDIFQNRVRIYETGGTNRGVYIDMANGATGSVGTNLLSPSSAIDSVARNTANAAFLQANTPSYTANSAASYANSAFAAANAATATDATQNSNISSAASYANSAFAAANAATATDATQNSNISSASSYANSAFAAANAATATDATQNNSITASFNAANAAFIRANNTVNANTGGTITGSLTISGGNLSVSGNLIISGNTVTQNVTTLNIADPLIYLAANNYSSDIVDIGFAGNYYDGATQRHAGFIRHAADGNFYVFKNYTPEPNNNVIDVNDASFQVATLYANIVATTVTAGGFNLKTYIDNSYNAANTADSKATSAGSYANSAFVAANSAASYANSAFAAANAATATDATQNSNISSASSYANSAFAAANAATATDATQNTNISSAASYANGAFVQANAAFTVANNAFTSSNGTIVWSTANSAASYANSAFVTSNSAASYANSAFAAANAATATDTTQNNSITAAFATANSAASYANSAFAAANAANFTDTTQNNSITAAFATANSAASYANSAFAAANTANATDTTQNNSITAAFTTANSAGVYANGAFTKANSAATVADILALSIALG